MSRKWNYIQAARQIRLVNFWDMLTGIPAGMSAFVAAALLSAIIGDIEVASVTFLWLLTLSSALVAVLVGITRGEHAAPSAFIQGLFTVGSALWLWLSVYQISVNTLYILPILGLMLVAPLITAQKAREMRSGK